MSARTTSPGSGKDDVEVYARTYTTILRSSGDIRLQAFVAAHNRVRSSLHAAAGEPYPDAGAFIYAIQRLPAAVAQVQRVILGQEGEQFRALLGPAVSDWTHVEAPARRRQWRWDGQETMTVHVASPSDLDDVIPCLVAYQIEWNKLNTLLTDLVRDPGGRYLLPDTIPDGAQVAELGRQLGFAPDDWLRLQAIWADDFWTRLRQIAREPKDMAVRLLGGYEIGYTRLVRRWWRPIHEALRERGLTGRPLYFISSNLHGVVNLVSGYARRRQQMFWEFLEAADGAGPGGLAGDSAGHGTATPSEIEELRRVRGKANAENVLYYAGRLWHRYHQQPQVKLERRREEEQRGIIHIDARAGFEVGAQIIELARIDPQDCDPRLGALAEVVHQSNAVLLNVDYPLGLASYYILRELVAEVPGLQGVYAIGKAATLNGAVGDVMISNVVYDEHSGNTYTFDNAFAYDDVAPFLERGSALDNQKAVTVRGTFLQNRDYLEFYYREQFTVVEMEAGPLLSAIYEASHPTRHPTDEHVHFRRMPFDFGFIHYASDTPYTQARTLGSRSLSFEGTDSTYASTVAVLRRILSRELRHAHSAPVGQVGQVGQVRANSPSPVEHRN